MASVPSVRLSTPVPVSLLLKASHLRPGYWASSARVCEGAVTSCRTAEVLASRLWLPPGGAQKFRPESWIQAIGCKASLRALIPTFTGLLRTSFPISPPPHPFLLCLPPPSVPIAYHLETGHWLPDVDERAVPAFAYVTLSGTVDDKFQFLLPVPTAADLRSNGWMQAAASGVPVLPVRVRVLTLSNLPSAPGRSMGSIVHCIVRGIYL